LNRGEIEAEARRIQVFREAPAARAARVASSPVAACRVAASRTKGGVAGGMPTPDQQRLGPLAEAGDRRPQMRGRGSQLTGSARLAGHCGLLSLPQGGAGI
jgi:hypothetical protein